MRKLFLCHDNRTAFVHQKWLLEQTILMRMNGNKTFGSTRNRSPQTVGFPLVPWSLCICVWGYWASCAVHRLPKSFRLSCAEVVCLQVLKGILWDFHEFLCFWFIYLLSWKTFPKIRTTVIHHRPIFPETRCVILWTLPNISTLISPSWYKVPSPLR